MRCAHCGSKDVLEQPYSIFCRKCSMETMILRRSKLDDVSPVGQTVQPRTDAQSWIRAHVYVLIALMFIVGFVLAKVTA